jgi:hypothetical protein
MLAGGPAGVRKGGSTKGRKEVRMEDGDGRNGRGGREEGTIKVGRRGERRKEKEG